MASLDSFMTAEVQVHQFNGNVLVAKAGKLIYQRSFGYSNYDTKTALDSNSIFELASVSKQFTAMGILQLKDQGKLSLSDTLRKFFPELPYANVTIQHLLTHTSGLPDYMEAMAAKWDHKKIAFNKDVIHFLATEKIPANFQPGAKSEYSNTAYEMLASIIEKVSGQSFQQYMQDHIFKPLGMQHTRIYNTRRSGETIPDYAYGYVYSDSQKRYVLPDSLSMYDLVFYLDGIVGDGTVNSTTGDLLKWDRALKEHMLLSERTQKEMFTPQTIFDTATNLHYGYGVFLGENEVGRYITHGGGWPGYHTNLIRYIDRDITVIILSNNQGNASALAGALTYIILDKPVIRPYVHKAMAIDSTLLDKFTGKYSVPFAGEMEVIRKNSRLFRRKTGMPDVGLVPESPTKLFFAGPVDQQLEFELDDKGQVKKAYFIAWGMKKEMRYAR
jgi:CubicO group peptidase (beta-lactamase class C family)